MAPAVPPEFIRTLPYWRCLVISMNRAPVVVKFRPAWRRLAHRKILRPLRPPTPLLLDVHARAAAVPAAGRARPAWPAQPPVPTAPAGGRPLPALRLGPEDPDE
jgi:hypothetical protein